MHVEANPLDTAPAAVVAHFYLSLLQVPVMRAHAESINLEFENPLDEDEALKLLGDFPGVFVMDDRAANRSVLLLPSVPWLKAVSLGGECWSWICVVTDQLLCPYSQPRPRLPIHRWYTLVTSTMFSHRIVSAHPKSPL